MTHAWLPVSDTVVSHLSEEDANIWAKVAPRKALFHLGRNGQVEIKELLSEEALDDLSAYISGGMPDLNPAADWFSSQV
jgi:hypothetical protein